jgi:hypothetical protein
MEGTRDTSQGISGAAIYRRGRNYRVPRDLDFPVRLIPLLPCTPQSAPVLDMETSNSASRETPSGQREDWAAGGKGTQEACG